MSKLEISRKLFMSERKVLVEWKLKYFRISFHVHFWPGGIVKVECDVLYLILIVHVTELFKASCSQGDCMQTHTKL